MTKLLLSIALLNLLAAMTPGPDFAIVTKNTLQHSRRIGIITALGVSIAILIHITYCSLGLAVLISKSTTIFNIIKIIGGCYLIYLGINALKESKISFTLVPADIKHNQKRITGKQAFIQGFLTNLLNPKAAIFFLALFTMIVHSGVSWFTLKLAVTLFITVFTWFSSLTLILSHKKVTEKLQRSQRAIICAMGVFLIGFGFALFFAKIN